MRRTLDLFYRALMGLAALAMLGSFVAVMLGIVDRQFAWGLRGLDAYAGYAIAAALFLALPGTLQRGEHIRVTLILQRMPAAWRAGFEWWCLAAALALSVALAFYATRMVWVSRMTNDISQGSDATPLWLPQIAMALGCIGLALAFADALLARARRRPFFREAVAGETAHAE
ncbi:MAG: TRAP transporter small permease subunit [Burkholderiales bacterium]|nr:TRAP transporter small permease subunit [Burkholderiales bacterium]